MHVNDIYLCKIHINQLHYKDFLQQTRKCKTLDLETALINILNTCFKQLLLA